MKNYNVKGISPAMVAPFDSKGEIDCQKGAELAKKLIETGVTGLYVGGSSAEMYLCSVDERKAMLEAVAAVKGDANIIAHIGAMNTKDSVKLAKHAALNKADAISSVTPVYFTYSFEEIKNYYKRLCEESGLPMIIYNIPARTGVTFSFEQLSELLSMDGVAGMKYTMYDGFLLNRLKTAFPEKIFYSGPDEALLSNLAAGADGGIGTTYNFMPELFLEIYRLFNENKLEEARRVQSAAADFIAKLIPYGVIAASKQMVTFSGIDCGSPREPMLPLSNELKDKLYKEVWLPLEQWKADNLKKQR